jgi:hypothetical protein
MNQCAKHICNFQNGEYYIGSLFEENYNCFKQILCSKCNQPRHIYANGMCKSCYNLINSEKWGTKYIKTNNPVGRKRKINIDDSIIIELHEKQGKSFQEISEIIGGTSRQAIYSLYKRIKNNIK